jgi:hypothetical protein
MSRTTYLLKSRSGQAILAFEGLAEAREAQSLRQGLYKTTLTLVKQTIIEEEID